MTITKRNVYDLLTRPQIAAMLDLLESGISELSEDLADDDGGYYSDEDVRNNEAKIALAQEAYELIAGDIHPEHAAPHTLAQLNILDIRNGEWQGSAPVPPAAEVSSARRLVGDAARAILGHLGEEGGVYPGQFEHSIIVALTHADRENIGRLAAAFPPLVAAWAIYKDLGVDGLRDLLPAKIQ